MIKIDFEVDIIYVLNLKRHKKRKQRITNLFKKHGIKNYEFFEAIPGGQLPLDKDRLFDYKKLINDGILNKWFADPNGLITKNIIACAWSHLKIYEKFVKTDYETCLILEDDVIFSHRMYEYVLDGRFESIKKHIKKFDVGIFHWGKAQMDEIHGSELLIDNTSHFTFPRNVPKQSAQSYQINKWTANHLIETGYPIKKAADVLLDHTKVKINCPEHSLFIQSNGPVKQESFDKIGLALWNSLTDKEYDSSTAGNTTLTSVYFEANIGIDLVRFRNYKTADGAILHDFPILYFKE